MLDNNYSTEKWSPYLFMAIQNVLGLWITSFPHWVSHRSLPGKKKIVYWYEFFLFREPRRWGFSLWHFLKNNAVRVLKALPSLWLDSHPCIRWNAASSTSVPFRCFHFQPRFSLSMMYWSMNRPCLFPVSHLTYCNLVPVTSHSWPRPGHGLLKAKKGPSSGTWEERISYAYISFESTPPWLSVSCP